MYRVGCVIVTYNIGNSLLKTYDSIKDQIDEIIFIDNNSDKDTKLCIKKICKENEKCDFIFNESNVGIAKALNQGIKIFMDKEYDFILTLDHDSVAQVNMISNMLKLYDKLKKIYKIGIISPAVFDINKNDYLTEVSKEKYQIIKEPIQSGSLLRVNMLKEIGLYNEDLVIYYVDTDLCYRGIKKTYTMIQHNIIILNHEEGKKTKHKLLNKEFYYNNYNSFAIYYRARNNVIMLKKYGEFFEDKNRLFIDFIKILLLDKYRFKKMKSFFYGILSGIKYKVKKEKRIENKITY